MAKGTAFLRADGSGHMHLKVVISEPDPEGMVLVVSVTSVPTTRRFDQSCILEAGCHDFITRRSYVSYAHSVELNNVGILKEKFKGELISKPDATPDILERIQEGARVSRFLSRSLRKYFAYF
jgi:hypothetical protein